MTDLCEPGEHRLGKDGVCLDCGDDRHVSPGPRRGSF
jgi:hypothetical protein